MSATAEAAEALVDADLVVHAVPSLFFFFSSRRRHTRYWHDWSSDVCSSDLELERQGDEPLLRAVVQIALQAPALEGRDLQQPPARGLQLLDARAQLRLQALVVDDRPHERRLAVRVGADRARGADLRDDPPAARRRQLGRAPVPRDVLAGRRPPEEQLQRRVA